MDDQRTGKLPCEERQRKLDLFSPENKRLRGDLITMFQYLTSAYREDGNPYLQAVTCKRPVLIDTNYSCREQDWIQEDHFS